jgi:hypothetical protein
MGYRNYYQPRVSYNPKHVDRFSIPGYRDLGWQLPAHTPETDACRSAGHKTREVDNSLIVCRGTDVITICDECKHLYHTDMSD